ncbi:RHS repeat protein, partial [Salmonella enterica]|nr:RHS repeat protein [Salmonella enterica]
LHREVQRRFGSDSLPESYELTTTYTPGGQLQQQHLTLPQLDREYGYDEGGRLVRISGPQQTREYRYSEAGRLTGVHTTAANLDITLPYATDPAGNRLPDPEFYPESSSTVWADNRITEDMQYRYRYDRYGRLTEKTDRIPEGVIRMHDERTHRYEYDNQHRLVRYVRTQYGETQAEGRYIYDPTGRRVGKRVWKREPVHWSETRTELSARPYETWYGWEGDRLATIRTQQRRVQTVYAPGSFTPLLRVETENTELAKTRHRSLAEKLEQEGSGDGEAVQFPAALRAMLDRLEDELRRDAVSEESRAWLTQCGLTAEQMKNQLEPRPEPERKLHLYHCDHRGLPLALISPANTVAWRAEYDEWGNLLSEENPEHLEQLIRLPGQQYDEESGLHYNRHRYYSPGQGRYITQDPVGLAGGLNPYTYPLNPVIKVDPLGLSSFISNMGYGVGERSSLGLYMCENGESPEDIANAMSPPPPRPSATGECRASVFAAAGSGISGTISVNEKTGPGGLMSFPIAAVGARASATCGLKFRDPDAKDLKVNAGASFGLGIFSIEISQTSTWPEVYIGVGAGIGPEVKIPYTPSVSVPVF